MNSIIVILASLMYSAHAQISVPMVTIAQGTVLGSVATDGEYFEFYGIPYADSTSGSHRFQVMLESTTLHLLIATF